MEGKKNFNRLGGHRIEKRKNLDAMSCQQKSHRAGKKKKKLKKKKFRTTNVASPLGPAGSGCLN
jgi:hypothetical protein